MSFISMAFIAAGLVTSMWVATATLGKARSQEPPAMNVPDPNAIPEQNQQQIPPPPVDQPEMGRPAQATQGFVPEVPGSDGYVYDPSGKRDPFRPFGAPTSLPQQLDTPQDTSGLLPVASSDPLQTYDLSQLRVVGIIWQVTSPKAVVKDPMGKIHMIRKDTKIGRNNGFVSQIREGEILVVEPMVGEGGLPTATTRVMTLIR